MLKFKKSLSRNYIVNTVYQLLSVLIPVLILPHLSQSLGAGGIGLYGFNNSIVSYFVLVAASGTGVFGQREIAYKRGNRQEVSRVFWETQILRSVSALIALAAFIIYTFAFGKDKIALLILAPSLINVLLDISWMWSGLEEFSKLAFRFLIVKALYVLFILNVINTPDDVYLYIAGEVLFGSLSFILLWPGLGKHIERVKNLRPFRHWKSVFVLFIPSLAIQLYTVLDKTMLGLFAIDSYAENGYYEQAQGVIKSCMVLVTSMVTVMSPTISHCYANKDKENMKRYLYQSYRYAWFITVALASIISAIAPALIPVYLGTGFDKVSLLIRICCPLFVIIGLSNITGLQYFVPCNKIKQHTSSLIVGSVVNICLNLLLIPRFQSVGASIASVIAELCVTCTQFIFVFRIGELKIHKILLYSIKYLAAGAITGFSIVCFLSLHSGGWLYLILIICLSVVEYVVVLFLLRDKMVLDFIKDKTISIQKINMGNDDAS